MCGLGGCVVCSTLKMCGISSSQESDGHVWVKNTFVNYKNVRLLGGVTEEKQTGRLLKSKGWFALVITGHVGGTISYSGLTKANVRIVSLGIWLS